MAATAMLNLPEELVTDIFSKVKGFSSIAALCGQEPLPFNGEKIFTFSMDGEASIVGEGEPKPASESRFAPVVVRPIKFLYQTRVSDEFLKSSDKGRLNYLQTFGNGFSVKMARALDIAAIHGVNPRTMTDVAGLTGNNFDDTNLITNVVTYAAATADDNLDAAVQAVVTDLCVVNGIAISPAFGAAMAKIKVNGVAQYPEFRFGGAPASFAGYGLSMNPTVSMAKSGGDTDHVILGDFKNAFRWGYAADIPLEVIEYGDPDGAGRDLKQYNEVCLRAEAYIGWGILDGDSFAVVRAGA